MLSKVEFRVLRAIADLQFPHPNYSARLEVSGLSADRLSDVMASLNRKGCIGHYIDIGDGEVSALPASITALGHALLRLPRV